MFRKTQCYSDCCESSFDCKSKCKKFVESSCCSIDCEEISNLNDTKTYIINKCPIKIVKKCKYCCKKILVTIVQPKYISYCPLD